VRSDYAAGGPRLSLEPRGYVLGQLTRKPDGRTLILHLLNYDHQAPAENVKVRLELNGLVQDLSQWQVKVLSPDTPQPQFTGLSLHGHRRVRPEPDRALYRGDFLAQSRVHDERRFELALVLRNKLGPICPTAATDSWTETTKRPRTTAESTARRILDVGWPILHQEHLHVGKAPQARIRRTQVSYTCSTAQPHNQVPVCPES
jgi:hypothetical protein